MEARDHRAAEHVSERRDHGRVTVHGRSIAYESALERDNILLLSLDPTIEEPLAATLATIGPATPQALLAASHDEDNQARAIPYLWRLVGGGRIEFNLDLPLTMSSPIAIIVGEGCEWTDSHANRSPRDNAETGMSARIPTEAIDVCSAAPYSAKGPGSLHQVPAEAWDVAQSRVRAVEPLLVGVGSRRARAAAAPPHRPRRIPGRACAAYTGRPWPEPPDHRSTTKLLQDDYGDPQDAPRENQPDRGTHMTLPFEPRIGLLPAAQAARWPELRDVPPHFSPYGRTALALHLGHRASVDFDFLADREIQPEVLLTTLPFLAGVLVS